ncbi:MAG: LptF/LptG family permease [Acidobacteriota bacterium]
MRRLSPIITRYFFFEVIPFALLAYLILSLLIAIQQLGRQASITLLSLATVEESLTFILLIVPGISLITLPMAILIGTLIALNRLKADSELTAARACGISPIATNLPFALIGAIGTTISLVLTLSFIPTTLQRLTSFRTRVLARGLIGQVKPQTFETRFPGHLVYIQGVDQKTGDWLGVFLLRQAKDKDQQTLLLTARKGQLRIVETPELALEVQLSSGVSLLMAEDPNQNSIATFEKSFLRLSAERDLGGLDGLSLVTRVQSMSNPQLSTFIAAANPSDRTVALVEWHKRRSVPIASLVLVFIAIVIGLKSQKPRSKAIGIALGFSIAVVYYLCLTAGQNLAQSRIVPPWAGIWAANIVGIIFALFARYLRFNFITLPLLPSWKSLWRRPQFSLGFRGPSTPRFSNLINFLLISEIVRIFVLGAAILVATTLVFTLFDLIPSIARSQATMGYIGAYFVFLSPQILYYTAPFALLIATLTAYFILSRTNQLVVLSASGLSLVRLAVPIAILAILSAVLLFALSDAVLPYTNREQDSRYHQIKGKKLEQAAFALGQRWVYGGSDQIFGFHYLEDQNRLLKTYVYRLKADTQLLESVTNLESARHESGNKWRVESGWRLNVNQGKEASRVENLTSAEVVDLGEGEATFVRTINESSKLSFGDLNAYIAQLRKIGAATYTEQIDLWRRVSHPLACLTLIVLSMPWVVARRFHSRRDTLAGVGIGVVISILFWLTTQAFEVAGKNALLPVSIAVWGAHLTSWSLAAYLWGRKLHR